MTDFSNDAFYVIERVRSDNHRVYWKCQCHQCGKEVILNTNQINTYKSCGCEQYPSRAEFLDKIRDSESKWNKKLYANNKSGVRGVSFNKRTKLWVAHIGAKGEKFHLGSYKNKSEAIEARKEAELKYWRQRGNLKF